MPAGRRTRWFSLLGVEDRKFKGKQAKQVMLSVTDSEVTIDQIGRLMRTFGLDTPEFAVMEVRNRSMIQFLLKSL